MIDDLWYKNSVFYSLQLETFMDANGDGVGDFEGLSRRLPYLEALGVDVLWLSPFYPSPNRDDGYDVADFYGIDPRHGSGGDFVEFMQEARARGMRVIIDLVVNHTSDRHRWFQSARQGEDAPWHGWYVWSKKRPKDWRQGTVFPGVQRGTWSRDEKAGLYYFHRFYDFEPDLDWDNPDVRTEVSRIIGYWLELGVSGFRMDAVPFILEPSPPPDPAKIEDLHFEYLKELRRFLQWRASEAILLGEANVLPKETRPYFAGGGDGLHMMFDFFVNQHVFYALATADVAPLVDALKATRSIPPEAQWAQFLRNHDELDLGRLSDEQRERVFARFAPDPDTHLYGRGIRRRLAPMLGDRRQIELAYSVMFSLPGSPVLRYGDEIGMGDLLSLPERYPVRTPMQWTSGPNAGFSSATKLVRPLVDDDVYGYRRVNVEDQRRDRGSLLHWMIDLIRLRKECPEIGFGSWKILGTGAPGTLALRFDWRGSSVLVVHNFADHPRVARVRPAVPGAERLVDLRGHDELCVPEGEPHRIPLPPYGYRWFRVGSVNYALERSRT